MHSLEHAWRLLAPHLAPLAAEPIPRAAADGRVLAEAVVASSDLPPCDVSAMDGFALRGPAAAGDRRRVGGTIAAGAAPGARLDDPADALRIMTGAPIPDGADRVVPVEDTRGDDLEIDLTAPVAAGANLRRRGEVVRAGAPLMPAGAAVSPAARSLLAGQGVATVPVVGRPRVAILTTGDEVVDPSVDPAPGQLRDSHTDFLLAALARLGIAGEPLGIAPDHPARLSELIGQGLAADVLLVCGGVSAGLFDHVEPVLAAHRVEVLVDSVAIQPGKPLVIGHHRRADGREGLVFGLPGNPGSVITCYALFVRPALRCLLGHADAAWGSPRRGLTAAPLPAAPKRDRFLPAALAWNADGEAVLSPLASRGSHDLPSWATADALVRVPTGAAATPAGAVCRWIPLRATDDGA